MFVTINAINQSNWLMLARWASLTKKAASQGSVRKGRQDKNLTIFLASPAHFFGKSAIKGRRPSGHEEPAEARCLDGDDRKELDEQEHGRVRNWRRPGRACRRDSRTPAGLQRHDCGRRDAAPRQSLRRRPHA